MIADWMPVFAAIVVVVGGAVAYLLEKIFDRREQVRARHFIIYIEMVEAICAMANSHNEGGKEKEKVLSNYATAKMRFSVVASEKVVRRFIAFDQRITSGVKVLPLEYDTLLAEFLREVRRENLGKTKLTNEELIVITPFGKSLRK